MGLRRALRRAPWLPGALLLLVALALSAAAVELFGLRHWTLYVGIASALVLAFGALERAWLARPLRPARRLDRRRFRVMTGGKDAASGQHQTKGGNGHARDVPGPPEDDDDKPRWVM